MKLDSIEVMVKKFSIFLIIVSLLIGFGIGKISEKGAWQSKLTQAREEIDWLKSELEMFYPPLVEEIYSLSGIVAEKGDKFLVMEAQIQVSQFPLPEGKEFEKQNVKVNVTEETEIFRLEMIELLLLEEPGEMPPEPFKKVISSFEEIKTGGYIFVVSEENIRGKKEITAKEIQIGY